MKKNLYLNLFVSGVLVLSPLAAIKAASLINLGLGSSSQSGVNTSVDANVDLDVNDANTVTSADVGANTAADTDMADISVDADSAASADSVVSTRSVDVATQADLKAYATTAIRENSAINSMDFTTQDVAVNYKDKGRFIGLIPVTLSVKVSVDQNGKVSVDYPWYGFLVAKDKADIESRVGAEVASSVSANGTIGWTSSDKARLAEHIVSALDAHYQMSASANATSTGAY